MSNLIIIEITPSSFIINELDELDNAIFKYVSKPESLNINYLIRYKNTQAYNGYSDHFSKWTTLIKFIFKTYILL